MNTPIDQQVPPRPLPGISESRRTWQAILAIFIFLLATVGLYLTSLYSYLLFHSLAEMVSIAISLAIFLLVWNARSYLENHYLLFLGIGMFFVVIVTIVHTLAYKGMGVFIGFDSNLPTSLWIISRYMLALTFFFALGFVYRKLQPVWVFLGYAVATTILLLAVFVWPVFPVCYVEGSGLTAFKVISEYVISALFLLSLAGLWWRRKEFPSTTVRLLAGALLVSVLSELAFTLYVGVYSIFNLLGHLLLVFSCVLIYQAVVVTGMRAPYALLYRNLTRSEEQYRSLFDNMLEGVSYCRLVLEGGQAQDWVYLQVNRAFERLTGLVGVAGKRGSEAIPGIQEVDPELLRVYARVALGGMPEHFEMFVQSLQMWFSVSVYCPQREYFVTAFDVITDRKQAEEKLAKARTDFLFGVSHELKTPLFVMRESLALLEQSDPPERLAKLPQFSETLQRNLHRLQHQIDNLLDSQRWAANGFTLSLQPTDLVQLLQDLLQELEILARQKGIRFRLETVSLPSMSLDPEAMHRLLENLLSNAIKYSPAGGEVFIRLQREPEGVRLSIIDQGPGIPLAEQTDLFQPFHRARAAKQALIPGTGLGLYVAKSIAVAHGGTIALESEPGKGTTVTVRLPMEEAGS
ncbi:MAG: MASE3 domain-containing protein [bacterium]